MIPTLFAERDLQELFVLESELRRVAGEIAIEHEPDDSPVWEELNGVSEELRLERRLREERVISAAPFAGHG